MAQYQYVLRHGDHDEVRMVEHDSHKPGDHVEIAGKLWVVVAIRPMPRWDMVSRIILQPAERR